MQAASLEGRPCLINQVMEAANRATLEPIQLPTLAPGADNRPASPASSEHSSSGDVGGFSLLGQVMAANRATPEPGSAADADSRPMSPLGSIYSGSGSLRSGIGSERGASPVMIDNLVRVVR